MAVVYKRPALGCGLPPRVSFVVVYALLPAQRCTLLLLLVFLTERAARFAALGVSVPEPAAPVVHCLWPHIRVAALPLADRRAVVFRCRMHCGFALSLPVILLPSPVG